MDRKTKNIIIAVCGVILIIISFLYFIVYRDNLFSISFFAVLLGCIGINIIVWNQQLFFKKQEDLTPDSAKFFYSETVGILKIMVTGFGIIFSILWGTLYVRGLDELVFLQQQTIILTFFIFYLVSVSFFTVLSDLKKII